MSTNQFRRYLDLLNEADLVPPNTNVALPSSGTFSNDQALANLARKMSGGSESRCAFCGTPQSQHQQLQHQFVEGGNTQPSPVAQGGGISGDISRIKQLQRELLAAGAELGRTGANRDGIDGDIGPLTRAAMIKYPDISAKYADLSADPAAQASTPAVDTSKLTSALDAIETIIKKYKGKTKVSESKIYEADRPLSAKEYQDRINRTIPPDPVAPGSKETPGFQQSKIKQGGFVPPAAASAAEPTQSVYDRFNKPNPSPAGPAKALDVKGLNKTFSKNWTTRAGQAILSKLPGLGARTATRAGATALSGPLAPIVGAAGTLYTIYDIGKMLYDAYKDSDNLEGMNDADQAVIKQNLAVVNSFMKDPKIANTLSPEIQSRVEKVYLDLEQLAKETGFDASAGAASPTTPAPTPAQTPAQTSTPAAAPVSPAVAPKIKDTVDKLDALLKKNKFESREPRTLSEQLARDRDIVNEGLGDVAKWAGKNVIAPTAKFAWNDVIKPSVKYVGGGVVNNVIAPAARLTTKAATLGGIGYGGYKAWEAMTAPKTMSAEDQAEFNSLLADYKKMVPDQAAFDALPPDVQEKLIAIANRVQNMEQQGNK
jgi:hypothetical protein